jgi:L-ribulose-5-phosphate 4-epimerase
MLEELRNQVLAANLELARSGLVQLTWGNVSGIDRERGLMVIKPSGVEYSALRAEDLVVLDLDGRAVDGKLKPSSDTPSHLVLYRAFKELGGITHAHSVYATMFAQACREIPCLGTTHADQFCGAVPLARALTPEEVEQGYEVNTGRVIVERLAGVNPLHMPAVLAAHHGPFTWGKNAADAVRNAVALETVAKMAWGTLLLNPGIGPIPAHILDKHWQRKHGPAAYYGQKSQLSQCHRGVQGL